MIQKEGPGWQIAMDSSRGFFPFMIGGDDWAIELTKNEWETLIPLIDDLISQHQQMQSVLMPEEMIALEIERKPWWGCLEGYKDSWSLQLILYGQANHERGAELFWPMPAAQKITTEMRRIWDSFQ